MRANLILLVAIVCFVGSCANPGPAPTGMDPSRAVWGPVDGNKVGPASGSPRDDYPGPALTGGGGGD
jgi:hypothetical protein